MKTKLFIIGLFLFALAACVKVPEPVEGPSPKLCAIDSLLWHQPDSALAYLLPYFDTCVDAKFCVSTATTYNRHYAHLLLSELLYKNDYAQTNRTELLQAVGYFDSLMMVDGASAQNIAFLDARAHYINGVGYYENDSMVEACKEYLKALEVMEEHFDEKELVEKKAKFMVLTYTRLSSLFSDMYLHDQAIYFAQLSLVSNQKLDVPDWHIARMLCEIGIQYNLLEQLDSADCYYKSAAKVLNDTNCLLYRDISTRRIVLSYKKKGIEESTLLKLHYLMSKSNGETEYLLRCFTIGGVFYQEKQLDSAWYYLNKVYNNIGRIALKKQAAEWLLDICKTHRKNDDVFEYADFLAPFANQEENQSEIKSQLTELYNSYRQASLSRQHQQALNKNITISMIVFAGLIAGLLVIIIFYRKNKQSKQKLEMQMEAERHAHRMQQAALAGRLRQSNAALKEQDKIKSSVTPLSFGQDQNVAENYTDEPICRQILSVCNDKSNPIKSTVPVSAYVDIALNDAQKAQLREAALRHYGALFEKLRLQYPEMKEKDFLYCYLCLLGLDNVQIAVLLQNSTSTIWERENRLKKIFSSENKIAIVLFGLINN